jgi:hypothetical protein
MVKQALAVVPAGPRPMLNRSATWSISHSP